MQAFTHMRICHRVTRTIAILILGFSLQVTAQESASPAVLEAIQTARGNGNEVVELQTSLGPLHLELYSEQAPKSVENFLTYVKDGFYDGTVFHRVIEGFMIQGGGLDARLEPKDTRDPIINEADNGLKNEKFTVAMARTGDPNSATAQFFINTANNGFLDHKSKTQAGWGYAVVGRVIGGMRIAEWMSKAPTGPAGPFASDVPVIPIVIEKALIP